MTLLEELRQTGEWQDVLSPFLTELEHLSSVLERERSEGKVIYPEQGKLLNALIHTQPGSLSAVITGQDPYHGMKKGHAQAMGLAFSVPPEVPTPPSLKNIQKELSNSLRIMPSGRGDLSRWACEENVLLINASLSVIEGLPGSHAKIGWDIIVKAVIDAVNQQREPLVFLAWGKHSHKLSEHLTSDRHLIIKTSHPSPLGATKNGSDFTAFLGSNCFKKANQFLERNNRNPINWNN
jgi:uracil-DNA glycosylase